MKIRLTSILATVLCLVALGCAPAAERTDEAGSAAEETADTAAAPAGDTGSATTAADRPESVPADSPNARYFTEEGREAAVGAFEEPGRGDWQMTEEILAALELEAGMTVADVGAGTGYFTRALASEVGPDGRVVAVDIIPEFLEELEARAAEEGLDNVETVLGEPEDPNLPAGTFDLVFVGDAYHHFDRPTPMLESLHAALRPGGRLAVVDWERAPNPRFEEAGLDWEAHIRLGSDGVIEEVEEHGFELVARHDFLEWQFFLIFERMER